MVGQYDQTHTMGSNRFKKRKTHTKTDSRKKTISKLKKPNDLVMQILFYSEEGEHERLGHKPSLIFKTDIVYPLY